MQEEAYAMALRRFREFAKEESKNRENIPEGPSFQYGPISSANSPYRDEYNSRLHDLTERKAVSLEYEGTENEPFEGSAVYSKYKGKTYQETIALFAPEDCPCPLTADEMKACIEDVFGKEQTEKKNLNVNMYDDGPYAALRTEGVRAEKGFHTSNAYVIQYETPSRPEKLDYIPIMNKISGAVQEAVEAKEVGTDLESALSGLEDSGMKL